MDLSFVEIENSMPNLPLLVAALEFLTRYNRMNEVTQTEQEKDSDPWTTLCSWMNPTDYKQAREAN